MKCSTLENPVYNELDSTISDLEEPASIASSNPRRLPAVDLRTEYSEFSEDSKTFKPNKSLFIQSALLEHRHIDRDSVEADQLDSSPLISPQDEPIGRGGILNPHAGFVQSSVIQSLFAHKRQPTPAPKARTTSRLPASSTPSKRAAPSPARRAEKERPAPVDPQPSPETIRRELARDRQLVEDKRSRARLEETVKELKEDNDRLRAMITYGEIQRVDLDNEQEKYVFSDEDVEVQPAPDARSRDLAIEIDRLKARLKASAADYKRASRRADEAEAEGTTMRRKLCIIQKQVATATTRHRQEMGAAAKKLRELKALVTTSESALDESRAYVVRLEKKLIEQQQCVIALQARIREQQPVLGGESPAPRPRRSPVRRAPSSTRPRTLTTATAHDKSPQRLSASSYSNRGYSRASQRLQDSAISAFDSPQSIHPHAPIERHKLSAPSEGEQGSVLDSEPESVLEDGGAGPDFVSSEIQGLLDRHSLV
ncbi:Chromosome partition protein Smc [Carpediemonas membranifera]|uniref:Chromosome partition protein Smc n=1 Tax=Carpediemonas membranifera TaxID=201153 RepID=A0A8J6B4H5_9EUKA|nr:Chromosome partition protein Smc [Carpediemonas membranifera]|eukprot:KAG9395523.1 Chromosome partition protein Smc [Carpediemonas membranifera]